METSIFDRLKQEIFSVKESLKQSGLTPTLQAALLRNQDILEKYYDKLVASNFVTSADEADINDTIIQAKRLQMEKDAQRTKRTLIYIVGGSLLIVGLIVLYNRLHK